MFHDLSPRDRRFALEIVGDKTLTHHVRRQKVREVFMASPEVIQEYLQDAIAEASAETPKDPFAKTAYQGILCGLMRASGTGYSNAHVAEGVVDAGAGLYRAWHSYCAYFVERQWDFMEGEVSFQEELA